jgi:hypothetical protein
LNADISQNQYISNLFATENWTWGTLSEVEYQKNQYQFLLQNNVVQCPENKPFAAKNSCISCQNGSYFFLDVISCKQCPDQSTFNVKLHLCIPNLI